ncbi:MAG: triose-phosphate isomerase [Planctomycetaceae bacterium]|nr:triose-phosphate isomerase [Planctomycetaceae bacterium]
MARKFFIAGNWKMNLRLAQSLELAGGLNERFGAGGDVDVVICPPAIYLQHVAELLKDSKIGVGAQNVHYVQRGPYTGEISIDMLLDVGVKYAIVGHSERRHLFNESCPVVNDKVRAILLNGLTPIICTGELLPDRDDGATESVVTDQVDNAFYNVKAEDAQRCVVAYEPVWAIGTGRVATPEQAEEVNKIIRERLDNRYGYNVAESIRILYGGSVTKENAKEIMAQPNVDGVLVGGASLELESFTNIIKAV